MRHMTRPNTTELRDPAEIVPPPQAEDGRADEFHTLRCKGLKVDSHCAHSGKLVSGKNVPATRKSGVRTALTT